jgi:hypothetical protein
VDQVVLTGAKVDQECRTKAWSAVRVVSDAIVEIVTYRGRRDQEASVFCYDRLCNPNRLPGCAIVRRHTLVRPEFHIPAVRGHERADDATRTADADLLRLSALVVVKKNGIAVTQCVWMF